MRKPSPTILTGNSDRFVTATPTLDWVASLCASSVAFQLLGDFRTTIRSWSRFQFQYATAPANTTVGSVVSGSYPQCELLIWRHALMLLLKLYHCDENLLHSESAMESEALRSPGFARILSEHVTGSKSRGDRALERGYGSVFDE